MNLFTRIFQDFCGSRTIAPEENCPPNHKTNPTPNPNPNRGQRFLRAVAWLPPNSKTNPDLDPNPNPDHGTIFLSGYRK